MRWATPPHSTLSSSTRAFWADLRLGFVRPNKSNNSCTCLRQGEGQRGLPLRGPLLHPRVLPWRPPTQRRGGPGLHRASGRGAESSSLWGGAVKLELDQQPASLVPEVKPYHGITFFSLKTGHDYALQAL